MTLTLTPPAPVVPDIFDDVTRREFIVGASALTALLTAGCGDDDAPSSTNSSAGFPRDVAWGDATVTLPTAPQRIFVGTDTAALDALLSFGVLPSIYCASGDPLMPWITTPGMADVPITPFDPINIEQVAGLNIDLALLEQWAYDSEQGTRVRNLVATLAYPNAFAITDVVAKYGELLGREDDAARITADRRTAIESWTPPRTPRGVTVFFPLDASQVYIYNPVGGFAQFLADCSVPLTDRSRPADETGFNVSIEQIAEVDDDLLLGLVPYADAGAALDELEQSPLFQAIPAVTEGRYTRLTIEESAALLRNSPLSVPFALDALTGALAT